MNSVINIVLAYNVLKLVLLYEKLYFLQRIHCLESFRAIHCQRQGLCQEAKNSHALRNLNFNEESPQMGRPQIDSAFVFY